MQGRTVLVTGASRGIGAEIAHAFAQRGAYVIGTRTSVGNDLSYCNQWIVADFSDPDQIESCAKKVAQIAPDVLVNNAGINKIGPFAQINPQDFLRIQQVNVYAPFVLCQAAIVNISSIWGKIGKEFRASYAASKFALDGITLALAAEHSKDGVLANCVAPGFTDTELTRRVLGEEGVRNLTAMVPLRRMSSPTEIAHFVTWLGSEENTYVTGQNLAIDGGFTRV
jgi:3-oxoacyl-[acyl-carrier protein] reductase